MRDQIEQLVEKAAIVDTINTLFLATDERNWTTVRECFASQVLFDVTSMTGGKPSTLSPEEIVEGWHKGLQPLRAVHHQTGNHRVEISGREADAHCYGIAYHYLPNPTGDDTRVFVGSYDFHLVKNDDRWQIDHFKFNLKFIDGNVELETSA